MIGADALFRPRRQLDENIFEAEVFVDRQHQIVDLEAFLHDLIFGDEDVGVVLREVAHAQHAVQRARRFIAMDFAELGDFQRQVAIAFEPVLINLHVARAVHRLAAEHALIRQRGRKHVLAVVLPVAREFPEMLFHHVGRVDFLIAGLLLLAAHVRNQRLKQRPTLGVPEHRARRFFLEMEQIHLAAELAVVALFGFLDLLQVSVEFLLGREGSAVNALQLRIVCNRRANKRRQTSAA